MEIYAELSKKLCTRMNEGNFFDLPQGVQLTRKANSRYCYFDCSDNFAVTALTAILDSKGIPWQENG